jgi:ATP-dependent Clp protease protease subunit
MDAETWMDAHKAVELGFADDIIRREEADDEPEPFEGSMLYSEAKVVNSLMDKIAKSCRIETKKEDNSVNADALLERLSLLKNWR